MSDIEWTNVPGKKGETINPQIGCREVSPGCRNCYAAKQAARELAPQHRGLTRSLPLLDADGKPVLDKSGKPRIKPNSTHWNGEIRRVPEQLEKVLRWRKPRGIFWGSMTDLFIDESEEARRFIAACFGVMAATPQHTHMVLTKRPAAMRRWFEWLDSPDVDSNGHERSWYPFGIECARYGIGTNETMRRAIASHPRHSNRAQDLYWPLPNVWLGTTVEDQQRADERIPDLLATPAAVHFLSVEPMVGPVTLGPDALGGSPESDEWARTGPKTPRIDQVICGGESGPQARPMHPAWVRALRDQCVAAGVPFFFKQWGSYVPVERDDPTWTHVVTFDGRSYKRGADTPVSVLADPATAYMRKVSKHDGGRELDGRTWDEFPEDA